VIPVPMGFGYVCHEFSMERLDGKPAVDGWLICSVGISQSLF